MSIPIQIILGSRVSLCVHAHDAQNGIVLGPVDQSRGKNITHILQPVSFATNSGDPKSNHLS